YLLTGDFATGVVTVNFTGGSFAVSGSPAYGNLASSQSFTVLGPTGALVDPADGAVLGARELNDRGYVDVPFVVPGGKTLDTASITDVATYDENGALLSDGLEITLGGGFTGQLVLDRDRAPVLVGQTGNTYVYRYWTRGTYTGGNLTIG